MKSQRLTVYGSRPIESSSTYLTAASQNQANPQLIVIINIPRIRIRISEKIF